MGKINVKFVSDQTLKQCNRQRRPQYAALPKNKTRDKDSRKTIVIMTLGMTLVALMLTSFMVLKRDTNGKWQTEQGLLTKIMMTLKKNDDAATKMPKFCLFPAHQERLTENGEMEAINRTLNLLYKEYPFESFQSSISHHHFVKMASTELQDTLKQFVWNPRLIQQCFQNKDLREDQSLSASGWYHDLSGYQLYHDPFDEIYWMRPEFDLLDQDNKVHYDGVLKTTTLSHTFPFHYFLHQDECDGMKRHIFTVRSLTYLNAGPSAEFVGLTSGRNFNTSAGTMIAIDFNQELQYSKMRERTMGRSAEPRIMIKSTVHLFPTDTPRWVIRLHIVCHRSFFFAIKSLRNLFESQQEGHEPNHDSDESQDDFLKQFGGTVFMALDNIMRSLNKVHVVFIGWPSYHTLGASVSQALETCTPIHSVSRHLTVLQHWSIHGDLLARNGSRYRMEPSTSSVLFRAGSFSLGKIYFVVHLDWYLLVPGAKR